jgi:hypothetical protein
MTEKNIIKIRTYITFGFKKTSLQNTFFDYFLLFAILIEFLLYGYYDCVNLFWLFGKIIDSSLSTYYTDIIVILPIFIIVPLCILRLFGFRFITYVEKTIIHDNEDSRAFVKKYKTKNIIWEHLRIISFFLSLFNINGILEVSFAILIICLFMTKGYVVQSDEIAVKKLKMDKIKNICNTLIKKTKTIRIRKEGDMTMAVGGRGGGTNENIR